MFEMNRSLLQQMLTYFSKVYNLGEKIKGVEDKRINPDINTSTIAFIVLMGFILQVPSFNRLDHWIEMKKFNKLLPKKTRIPRIDAIRNSLDTVYLDSVAAIEKNIVKTTITNKVFKNGTIDGYKVCAIDGVELFESTKKCCDDCLTRDSRSGVTHYFHRAVVCMTVGSDPHIIFGEEMLKPKKDGSNKDEGEITGGKRLISNLHDDFNHFADIVVADALYMKSTWIKHLLSLDIDSVVRVKDERLNIVKESIALFSCRNADKVWTVKKSDTKKTIVNAWDEPGTEMNGLDTEVRFVKFVEEIYDGDKVEFNEIWIVTTSEYVPTETLWKIIHCRWHIENNGFHQLKGQWHMDHCFLHSPSGIEAVLLFMIIAFNLMQLFFFRSLRKFRKRKLLQVEIIEDIRDELITFKDKNPILYPT